LLAFSFDGKLGIGFDSSIDGLGSGVCRLGSGLVWLGLCGRFGLLAGVLDDIERA